MASQPDARDHVLRGCGEVMVVVQDWELALAFVWWYVERKNKSHPAGDFDTPRSQKEIRRLEAAFRRVTAQASREAVTPHLEPQTADDLDGLMDARNRLAHRFLREHKATAGCDFQAGTLEELFALGNTFWNSYASIMRTVGSFEDYHGPVPAHWPALAERIIDRAFSGQPIPRDPRQQ
jgi:hypothetical protein